MEASLPTNIGLTLPRPTGHILLLGTTLSLISDNLIKLQISLSAYYLGLVCLGYGMDLEYQSCLTFQDGKVCVGGPRL